MTLATKININFHYYTFTQQKQQNFLQPDATIPIYHYANSLFTATVLECDTVRLLFKKYIIIPFYISLASCELYLRCCYWNYSIVYDALWVYSLTVDFQLFRLSANVTVSTMLKLMLDL